MRREESDPEKGDPVVVFKLRNKEKKEDEYLKNNQMPILTDKLRKRSAFLLALGLINFVEIQKSKTMVIRKRNK